MVQLSNIDVEQYQFWYDRGGDTLLELIERNKEDLYKLTKTESIQEMVEKLFGFPLLDMFYTEPTKLVREVNRYLDLIRDRSYPDKQLFRLLRKGEY